MKKEQRQVYITLLDEIECDICGFCAHAEHESEGCCEGYHYCVHPIKKLAEQRDDSPLESGDDCWAFRPGISLDLLTDIVGAVLSQGYDEWAIRHYSKTAVTVYGRKFVPHGDKTGKVRIGHDGPPKEMATTK